MTPHRSPCTHATCPYALSQLQQSTFYISCKQVRGNNHCLPYSLEHTLECMPWTYMILPGDKTRLHPKRSFTAQLLVQLEARWVILLHKYLRSSPAALIDLMFCTGSPKDHPHCNHPQDAGSNLILFLSPNIGHVAACKPYVYCDPY